MNKNSDSNSDSDSDKGSDRAVAVLLADGTVIVVRIRRPKRGSEAVIGSLMALQKGGGDLVWDYPGIRDNGESSSTGRG